MSGTTLILHFMSKEHISYHVDNSIHVLTPSLLSAVSLSQSIDGFKYLILGGAGPTSCSFSVYIYIYIYISVIGGTFKRGNG